MTGRGAQVQIEGYIDVEPVGSGGLGDVYRARRESTGVVVAIKVLRHVDDESLSWRRTQRELEALAALAGHGHVIGVLEVLPVGSAGRALVMEYAEGGSVAELLQRRGDELSVAETVLIGTHTASALEAAHERGIVHRDVKPQNLLIDRYGQVKLCDFGVASLLRSEQFRDRTSALSARYASPEDLEDDDDVGPPSDVYSLGATLLHLSRGAPPTMTERLTRWTPPAAEPDADRAELDRLIEWCLDPDPMRRPTAAALHAALDELGGQLAERVRALGVADDVIEADDLVVASGDAALDAPTELRNSAAPEPAAPRPPPRPGSDPHTDRTTVLLVVAGVLLALFVGFGVWRLLADDDGPPAAAGATTEPATSYSGSAAPTVAAIATAAPVTTAAAPATSASPATTAPPTTAIATLPTIAIADRPAHVAELDRYEFPPVERGQCVAASTGTEIAVIDCTEPHDAQYVGGGSLDGFAGDAAYDAEAVGDTTAARCRTARERFLADGAAELPGGLELRMLYQYPSADTWPDGDRTFRCWIASPTSRIIGDVRATG